MRLRALLLVLVCVALLGPPPSFAQPAVASATIGVLGGAFNAVAVVSGAIGAETICAGEGAALSVFKLQFDNNLVRVSRLELPGLVHDAEVVGSTAFVADDIGGLQVVDLTNVAAPQPVSSVPTPAAAVDLRVVSGIAYVVIANRGLQLVDVREPARPATLSFVPLDTLAFRDTLGRVDVAGKYAYVGGNALQVVDVHDLKRPVLRGSIEIPWGVTALRVDGDRAYVARHYYRIPTSGGFVDVIDLRDADHPTELGAYGGLGLVYDIQLHSDTLVAAGSVGAQLLDLRSAYDLPALTTIPLSGEARRIALAGAFAYVATGDRLHVLIERLGQPFASLSGLAGQGTLMSVVQSGARAYALDRFVGPLSVSNALRVIDVSTPTAPSERGLIGLSSNANFVITGTQLYAVTDNNRFQVFDVAGDQPVLRSDIGVSGFPTNVAVQGAFAYLARGGAGGGVQIVDVRDPAAPILRGYIEVSDGTTSIEVVGDIAYLAGNGFQVVDLHDPDNPVLLRSIKIVGGVNGFAVSGDHAYLSVLSFDGKSDTLLALDISDQSQPRIAATLTLPAGAALRAVANRVLYVGTDSALLLVDAATLTPRGAVAVPGGALGVAPVGDTLLVASGEGGLRALRVDPGAFTRVYLPLVAR